MKNQKEEIVQIEKERRSSEDKLKSLIIFFLFCTLLVGGFFLFQLNRENNQLTSQIETKLEDLARSQEIFQEIEDNLSEIRSREGLVSTFLDQDDNLDNIPTEDRIFQEIAAIEELNSRNNSLIEELQSTVDNQGGQIRAYRKTTADLTAKVKEYRTRTEILMAETADLRENLEEAHSQTKSMEVALNYKENEVKDKNRQLDLQQRKLEQKKEELNTAYYRVGSYKELKDEHVVYKEGGIAGIASVMSVRPDIKKDQFKKVDITNLNMVPINSKEAEVISNHDINTYEVVKDDSGNIRWLKINDPDKFWDRTKYLVVVTKFKVGEEVAVN